jgi:hypothetical protein
MDSQPLPPPLEHLASRPFSFYPPIVGIELNEWEYRQCTWSEIQVANRGTDLELWIPRRYFGEVSTVDEPVLIAGLTLELEFSGGMLHPYKPRLVRMPNSGRQDAPLTERLQPFKGLRMESSDRRIVKVMGIVVGAAILICVLAVAGLRIGTLKGRRVVLTASDQAYTLLNSRDDRFAVVSKIGSTPYDRSVDRGGMQYEALSYPQRKYTVILMGTDIKTVTYIGTVNEDWEPVHFVQIRSGGDTEALLRAISKF